MKRKQKQKFYHFIDKCIVKESKALVILTAMVISMVVMNHQAKAINFDVDYNFEPKTEIVTKEEMSIQEHVISIMQNEYGLSWPEITKALAVIHCESEFNQWAIGDNGKSTGLWQIHSDYHGDTISVEDTFCVYASTRWAIQK